MLNALKQHWPEYLMEAAELGAFMISACTFGILLGHPASPLNQAIPNPFVQRLVMGLVMGLTAIAIVYSPWGKQSGAHFNPALTLTFLRLGKVDPRDAVFYVLAHFAGGIAGVALVAAVADQFLAHPSVHYVATIPGPDGSAVAFLAELVISFLLMTTILTVTSHASLARFTGLFAGALVATFITFEAPMSGMSMNPARTFASAFVARDWTALWVYFTSPLIGMLLAAQLFLALMGPSGVACAKLHHQNKTRCIFCLSRLPSASRR